MGRIIVPTGYMGSGSSAITDLISEIDGYDADTGSFEYVFLHCPNGVFDLEDKLLYGNNALRSDEALHMFRYTMKQLFDKKYWWVGHYNTNLTANFMKYTEGYINALVQYRPEYYWYYQENADAKMIFKLVIRKLISAITFGKVTLKKPLLYNDLLLSYVQPEEFYTATKKYLKNIWNDLGIQDRNIVLDQLLLPFNLQRVYNYFDAEEIRVFVIDRDPRDVFILNKYVWSKQNNPIPYPTDVYEFCKCYKSLRKLEKDTSFSSVLRLHFEDLVYKYENTVNLVLEFLGESSSKHSLKLQKFNPERSIENTQLFLSKDEFKEETSVIEKELKEYLYEFPYLRKADCSKSF